MTVMISQIIQFLCMQCVYYVLASSEVILNHSLGV